MNVVVFNLIVPLYSKLKSNLKDDRKHYKGPVSGPTNLPAHIHLPEWQKDHVKAIQDMAVYAIKAGAEDDEDKDEGSAELNTPQLSTSDDTSTEDRGTDGDTEDNIQQMTRRLDPQAASVGGVHMRDTCVGCTSNLLYCKI